MRSSRLARTSCCALFAVLLTFGLSGCASGGGGTTADDQPEIEEPAGGVQAIENLQFEVVNDATPSSEITVYIEPYTGSRQRLGTIDPSVQGVFYFNVERPHEPHRLRAEGEGLPLVTNQFTLEGATQVRWTVSQVDVTVMR